MWIEAKYVSLLGAQLEQFSQKGPQLWNFRCPICKDSKKSKSKIRGYLFFKNDRIRFYCHNCNASQSFDSFLAARDNRLYQEYLAEILVEKGYNPHRTATFKKTQQKLLPDANKPLLALRKVSSLHPDHTCKKYVVSRQIPTSFHFKLYYTEGFMKWTNTIIPGKFDKDALKYDGPRLVIPLFDKHGLLFGYTGRALDPEDSRRYILIMVDKDRPKCFGLDTIDLNRKFYVLEGPIDSMFIPNSLAVLGSSLIQPLIPLDFDKDLCTLIFDNQPRNSQVVGNMISAAEKGYRVCVWPKSWTYKDINEAVLDKIKTQDYVNTEKISKISSGIVNTIEAYTHSGASAILAIEKWKKC